MLGNPTRLPDIERSARNALRACAGLGAGHLGLDRKEVAQTMGTVFAEFPHLAITLCAYTPADREAAEVVLEGSLS